MTEKRILFGFFALVLVGLSLAGAGLYFHHVSTMAGIAAGCTP